MSEKNEIKQLVLHDDWREFFRQTAEIFATLIELIQTENPDNPIIWALNESCENFSVQELAENYRIWLPDMPTQCLQFIPVLLGTAFLGWQLRKLHFPENLADFALKISLPTLAQQDVHKQKQNKILETIARFTLCFFMLAEVKRILLSLPAKWHSKIQMFLS